MHKFSIDGAEFETDHLSLHQGKLRIIGDALVVAALQPGGTFETLLEDDIAFEVELPEGQLDFAFDRWTSQVGITFELAGSEPKILFVDDQRELIAA